MTELENGRKQNNQAGTEPVDSTVEIPSTTTKQQYTFGDTKQNSFSDTNIFTTSLQDEQFAASQRFADLLWTQPPSTRKKDEEIAAAAAASQTTPSEASRVAARVESTQPSALLRTANADEQQVINKLLNPAEKNVTTPAPSGERVGSIRLAPADDVVGIVKKDAVKATTFNEVADAINFEATKKINTSIIPSGETKRIDLPPKTGSVEQMATQLNRLVAGTGDQTVVPSPVVNRGEAKLPPPTVASQAVESRSLDFWKPTPVVSDGRPTGSSGVAEPIVEGKIYKAPASTNYGQSQAEDFGRLTKDIVKSTEIRGNEGTPVIARAVDYTAPESIKTTFEDKSRTLVNAFSPDKYKVEPSMSGNFTTATTKNLNYVHDMMPVDHSPTMIDSRPTIVDVIKPIKNAPTFIEPENRVTTDLGRSANSITTQGLNRPFEVSAGITSGAAVVKPLYEAPKQNAEPGFVKTEVSQTGVFGSSRPSAETSLIPTRVSDLPLNAARSVEPSYGGRDPIISKVEGIGSVAPLLSGNRNSELVKEPLLGRAVAEQALGRLETPTVTRLEPTGITRLEPNTREIVSDKSVISKYEPAIFNRAEQVQVAKYEGGNFGKLVQPSFDGGHNTVLTPEFTKKLYDLNTPASGGIVEAVGRTGSASGIGRIISGNEADPASLKTALKQQAYETSINALPARNAEMAASKLAEGLSLNTSDYSKLKTYDVGTNLQVAQVADYNRAQKVIAGKLEAAGETSFGNAGEFTKKGFSGGDIVKTSDMVSQKSLNVPPAIHEETGGRPNVLFPRPADSTNPSFRDPLGTKLEGPNRTPFTGPEVGGRLNGIDARPLGQTNSEGLVPRIDKLTTGGDWRQPSQNLSQQPLRQEGTIPNAVSPSFNPDRTGLGTNLINKIPTGGEEAPGRFSSTTTADGLRPAGQGISNLPLDGGRLNQTTPSDGRTPLPQLGTNTGATIGGERPLQQTGPVKPNEVATGVAGTNPSSPNAGRDSATTVSPVRDGSVRTPGTPGTPVTAPIEAGQRPGLSPSSTALTPDGRFAGGLKPADAVGTAPNTVPTDRARTTTNPTTAATSDSSIKPAGTATTPTALVGRTQDGRTAPAAPLDATARPTDATGRPTTATPARTGLDPVTAFEQSTQRVRQLADARSFEPQLQNNNGPRVNNPFETNLTGRIVRTETGTEAGKHIVRAEAEARLPQLDAGRNVGTGRNTNAFTANAETGRRGTEAIQPTGREHVTSFEPQGSKSLTAKIDQTVKSVEGREPQGRIDAAANNNPTAGIGRIPLSGSVRVADFQPGTRGDNGPATIGVSQDGRVVGDIGRLPGARGFNQIGDIKNFATQGEIRAPRGETHRYITGLELALILSIAGIAKLRGDARSGAARLEGRTWSITRANGRPMIFVDGRQNPFQVQKAFGKGDAAGNSFRIMVSLTGDRAAKLSTRTMRTADIATKTQADAVKGQGFNMNLLGRYHYLNYFGKNLPSMNYYSQFKSTSYTGGMGLAFVMAAAGMTRGSMLPTDALQGVDKLNPNLMGPADRIRLMQTQNSLMTQFGRFQFDALTPATGVSRDLGNKEEEAKDDSISALDDYQAFLARLDGYSKRKEDDEDEEQYFINQGLISGEYLLYDLESEEDAEAIDEVIEDDTANGAALSQVLRRPKWVIEYGQTLDGIAERLFSNADLGWLIADLNRSLLRETYIDNKRIVELHSRQEIELPVWQDIQKFNQSRKKNQTAENLVTIVVERNIDREAVEHVLGKVVGAEA